MLAVSERTGLAVCPRCQGNLLHEWGEHILRCVNCGHDPSAAVGEPLPDLRALAHITAATFPRLPVKECVEAKRRLRVRCLSLHDWREWYSSWMADTNLHGPVTLEHLCAESNAFGWCQEQRAAGLCSRKGGPLAEPTPATAPSKRAPVKLAFKKKGLIRPWVQTLFAEYGGTVPSTVLRARAREAGHSAWGVRNAIRELGGRHEGSQQIGHWIIP